MIDEEETTPYHLIKSTKRREVRMIRQTQDQRGWITEDPTEIAQIFVAHLKDIYSPIDVSDSRVAEMLNAMPPNTPPSCAAYLEQPITAEELYAALRSGGPNKAPESDGFSREFCIRLWDTIRDDMLGVMNQMYINNSMRRRQQHGIIISLPKEKGDKTPADYRPITLMKTDYKLLARIMARRLTTVLEERLPSSQYCSVPGKFILESVSVLRDVVAHAELTRTALCILSLDFRSAFDCIWHPYLFRILAGYGISAWFIDRIRSMYENATASLQIIGAYSECHSTGMPA